MSTVLVPNNEPTPLQASSNIENVPAVIDYKGISPSTSESNTNTMNSRTVNSRSSLVVDANLAVVPTDNIINDKSISVTPPSNKSSTSVTNKLVSATKNAINKTGQVLSDVTQKVTDLFKGTSEQQTKIPSIKTGSASVVPVAENLSVLTTLPPNQAITHVPVPQSNFDVSATKTLNVPTSASQKSTINRFENKLAKAKSSTIPTQQSNRALQTIKNGNYSIKRTEEITRINQPFNQILKQSQNNPMTDISVTSNRTIAGPAI
jgi:hypothetical protein